MTRKLTRTRKNKAAVIDVEEKIWPFKDYVCANLPYVVINKNFPRIPGFKK